MKNLFNMQVPSKNNGTVSVSNVSSNALRSTPNKKVVKVAKDAVQEVLPSDNVKVVIEDVIETHSEPSEGAIKDAVEDEAVVAEDANAKSIEESEIKHKKPKTSKGSK